MWSGLVVFLLASAMLIGQSALYGLFAWWVASRHSRLGRIIGGIIVALSGWLSVVEIINHFTGYRTRSDLDICILTLAALLLGWLSGRNHRVQLTSNRSEKLILAKPIRFVSVGICGICQVYGCACVLIGFLMELRIVSAIAGFWGLVIGLTLAPVTFVAAPLYIGFQHDNWVPALVCYGCVVAAVLGTGFAVVMADQEHSL
jgi:hypothetical protein